LMAREFFLGDRLKARLFLYAALHLMVMPLALIWMAQMGAEPKILEVQVVWLALLSLLSGAAFEITRKTLGPKEERKAVDSYSKRIGAGGAPLLIMGLMIASTVVQVILLFHILGRPAWYWYLMAGLGLALALYMLARFIALPTAKGRKRNQAAVSLSMMLGYLLLIIAIIAEKGIEWSWNRI